MSQSSQPDRISLNNDESIKTLARAITYSQGEFSLILVRCNYGSLRESMMQKLRQQCAVEIQELELSPSSKTLYTAIANEIGEEQPQALVVFGLETVQSLDAVLASTNQVREEFRKAFAFPLVIWIDNTILKKLIKQVPDLESWASVVEFEMPPNDLMAFVQTTANEVFEELLDVGAAPFLSKLSRELGANSRLSAELGLAQQDVQRQAIELEPELAASLEFLLGLSKAGLMAESRQHYEQSISLWSSEIHPERQGCIFYQLGLWWRTHAVKHRPEYDSSCLEAVEYFQQAITTFEQAKRPDLVAKFINPAGEALQRLKKWDDLEPLARKSLSLNETYPNLYRKAEASSCLAEVLLGKSAWEDARQTAEQALQLLTTAIDNESEANSEERQDYIEWQKSFSQGWYLFALGRAQWNLGQRQEAIHTLDIARQQTRPEYDPLLFIQILRTLRKFYFDQKDYLKAFETRLAYRSLEQQYGFRAFVGAGRLQAQREVINPALITVRSKPQDKVSQEISASGRQEGVNRLIERISRADQKLIVLHGQSGVGKSSIIQAGLIPSLTPITLDTRQVITILQQVYTNWTKRLGQEMLKTLKALEFVSLPETVESPPVILEQLRKSVEQNLMVVLIFDQFEEFFFVHKEPAERKPFYDFLRKCLDIPYVKVILSLREDYLHYLLECNDRLVSLDIIGNNILDKSILFYLGNFSRGEAKSVIQSLTKNTPYPLNENLTEELVKDLSEELGEVRPIELQVVGAQLQTEQITTLEQYREKGPKDALVGRFLDEVTQDCGPANEDIARLVLYLLTDENNTRPLKTREDIELEINVADKLDLVLTILVRSGLVFRIPSFPSDRYQLVHDYLVIFVRQTQSTQLIAELEKEREQRQLTERQLNEALQRQLRTARKATLALTGLITAVTGIALFSFLAFINIYILNQASSSNEDELNRIISTTQAGNSLNRFPGVLPEVRIGILSEMDSAMADARLLNLWSSHEDEITDVVFSSDSQLFATASRDKTVQLWSRDGSLLLDKPLRHETAVTSVNFSPDNQLIVTGDENGYVRVWSLDGQLIQKLDESHTSAITSLAFSPNGQKLASSAGDGVIKIWNASWQYQGTVANLETDISGISFSNNGKLLASFAEFDIVRIWNLETLKEVSTIEGTYRTLHVSFSEDDQYLNVVDRTARLKKIFLDGELITGDTFRTSGNFLNKVSLHPDERFYVAIGSNVTNLSNIATLGKLHVYNEPLQLEHKAGLVSIALSPDQTLMITSDVDNRSYLWYVEPFTKNGFSNNAPSLRFNFDEQYFVAQTGFQKFNISDYKDKSREDIELDGRFLSFSPSGQAMIVANNNTSVKIWEAQPNKIISIRDDNQIVDSVLSQDGNIIATGHKDGVIKIWGKDGILIREIKAHSREIEFLELTYNGRKIFSGDGESLKVWDLDGVLISELSGLKQADIFNKVILSPNSNEFITFEHQGIVKLWNSDGTLIRQLTEYSVPVRFAQFSSDGTRFLLKANGSFYSSPESKIFGKDGTLIEDLTNFEPIATTQFHPDGTELLVALSQSAYYGIRRISFDNRVLFPFEGHVGRINEIQFSSDNETIATASDDTTIILWKRHANDFKPLRGHTSGVVSLDFSSDDHALASLDNEGIVKLWDINGNELNSFEEYSDQYAERYGTSINFTSNENFLVLVGWDRTTFIDKNGSEIYSFTTFKPTQLSSNNDSILIPIQEPELKIIDMNGNVISTLKDQHTEHINSAVFSPNEDRIASASNDDTVVLWSRDGEPIKIIEHEDDVNSVAFSKDGKFLVTASDDKIIRIFDKYGNPILDAQGNKIELTEHTDAVTSVLFSPNGKHLASASTDGTMRLWDAKDWQQDGREIVTSSNTSGNEELDALWFSEDGNILAYGTNPTYIRLLNRRFRGGFFIKSATFHPVTEIPENGFPDNNGWLTVRGNRGIIALSLSVDHSLTRSCNWIVGHLQSNDNENDDNLCNGILGGR